jgi:surfactin synthase thioesterase subunit
VRLCASASILAFTIAAEANSRAFLPAACFAASLAAPPAESAVDIAVHADSGKTQTMQVGVVTPNKRERANLRALKAGRFVDRYDTSHHDPMLMHAYRTLAHQEGSV